MPKKKSGKKRRPNVSDQPGEVAAQVAGVRVARVIRQKRRVEGIQAGMDSAKPKARRKGGR